MTAARKRLATVALGAAALAIAGCGGLDQTTTTHGKQTSTSDAQLTQPQSTGGGGGETGQPNPTLPERPAGLVSVEGDVAGSLTLPALHAFEQSRRRSGLAVTVQPSNADEATAFNDLCSGKIDIVDAATQITEPELAACKRNGLQVIDFKAAFDGTVLATRNERDVGADCITVSQAREMFRAGSPLQSWNQINPLYRPVLLRTVGRRPPATEFDFFAQRVLGAQVPSLADFRSDYQSFDTEDEVRKAVSKTPPGAIGIYRFAYYQQWEEELRPLEIDGETGDRCVFPSPETISSELYPLGRTLHLYTTDRSLKRLEVQEFLRSYLQAAPDLATRAELIAVPQPILKQELRRVEHPETEPGKGGANAAGAGTTTTPQAAGAVGTATTSTTTTPGETPSTTSGGP
jgi:ABC-type phosphate transport system substrate-binding protein